jgi:hypothetical protein
MKIPLRLTLTISLSVLAAAGLLARPVHSTPRDVVATPTALEVMRSEGVLRPTDEPPLDARVTAALPGPPTCEVIDTRSRHADLRGGV